MSEMIIHEEPNRCFIDPNAPKKRRNTMPNHIYHAEEHHLSSSDLKTILRSPMHWKHGKDNPEEKKKSAVMVFGSAFHTALLEPNLFDKEFVVAPKFDARTKDGKAAKAEWESKNQGRTYISQPEVDKITEMKRSVLANPYVLDLLSSGTAEASFFTHLNTQLIGDDGDWTPIKVKCRPDFLRKDYTYVSVKTADNASPEEFARVCAKFKYDLSEAFYLDILSQFAKRQLRKVYMLVVEKDPPFAHIIYKCPEEFIAEGRHKYRKALKKYLYSLRSERFQGYEIDSTDKDGTLDVKLPGYGFDNVLFDKSFKQF